MATAPKYPPLPQPIADAKNGLRVDRVWALFFQSLVDQSAAAGSGTVTHTAGALTANELIVGNGGADLKVLGSLGTTTTVLHGNASGLPSFGPVVEADQSLSDVTTANVSIAAHGYAPKLPNDATKFLDGTGAYSVPAGGGGGIDQLTGDVTAGPGTGSQPATLAATAVTPSTYGDSTHVGQFTVDAKGRLTFAQNVAIAGSGPSGYWSELTNGDGSVPELIFDSFGNTVDLFVPV